MLDQFYNYLSEKVIKYFEHNTLKGGDKFYIQFELESQVDFLYEQLKKNLLATPFSYKDEERNVEYSTYMLDFNSCKLIVASTGGRTHPDFLTNLRNLVGIEVGYEDKAILFIHNTTLDSLIGGTASFHKEGMPFHIYEIEKDIQNILKASSFSEADKEIVEMTLKNKKDTLSGGNISVFEYEDLLSIINKTGIETSDYPEFGLFPDPDLGKYQGKELRNRLMENAKNYARVDEYHSYGLNEAYLEKYYDEKGIGKLVKQEWKNVKYQEIEKSIQDKKDQSVIEYIECCGAWDREDGTTKAKYRKRNIIAFRNSHEDSITFEAIFSEHLKKDGIECKSKNVKCTSAGKRLKFDISPDEKAQFFVVKYEHEDKSKFEFKILTLDIEEKLLEGIKAKYFIVANKDPYLRIDSNESQIVLNEFATESTTVQIKEINQLVALESSRLIIKIDEDYEYDDEDELARFSIVTNECVIPFGKMITKDKPSVIDGHRVWKMKKDNQCHFYITGDNKLRHGTREYFTRDEYRKNLEYEKVFIEQGEMCLIQSFDELRGRKLNVPNQLEEAFNKVLQYFRKNNVLPSLAYLDGNLKNVYQEFIDVFLLCLEDISNGEYLSKQQKDLFYIGIVQKEVDDCEILLSPFHPLNIAYQLEVDHESLNDVEQLEILKKLQSIYLLPFITFDPKIQEEKLYIPVEQSHSPEWKYYIDAELPRYKGSKEFVSKLVCEKIEEFIDHFSTLFILGNKSPIKINLVHTGDSREILQGIFKYLVRQLRAKKERRIHPIHIYIYSEDNIINAFDEFASIDDYDEIIDTFALDLKVEDMTPEEVIDVYRDYVSFFVKDLEKDIEYAHLTFLEMNEENKVITTDMKDINSGVILNGKISGMPSMFLGDSYRTGFGTKYSNTETDLMKIAKKLNAMNSAMTGDKYDEDNCKAISIAKKSQTVLDKIYDASHWVTFIDPKVDLNFFKNDSKAKELLIIHYSDQYTSSGGYDAITVTRKSKQYQNVIEEFLSSNRVENAKNRSPEIINMFNAINGDWLLRLISSRSHFPKEKISILSAFKVALNKFKADGVIWVPISLEEILRVSGGVGLKQKDGFFTAKNLGFETNYSMSDDLLLIGIREKNERVEIVFYPVEVKIGNNTKNYIEKGIEQAKKTRKLLYECMNGQDFDNFTQMIYRNFFMQLVVASAEKLTLYGVGGDELGWNKVINSDLRRKLLNEEYVIVEKFDELEQKEAAVVSFKKTCASYREVVQDNVLVLELSERAGVNILEKSIESIVNEDLTNETYYESEDEKILTTVFGEVASTDIRSEYEEEEHVTIESILQSGDQVAAEQNEPLDIPIDDIVAPTDDINLVCTSDEELTGAEEKKRHMEILFGVDQRSGRELHWYPNDSSKVFHTNTGIIGTMGTGKTQFTKSVITQIYRESKYNLDGKELGILIFDYKGDYNKNKQDFIDATNATVYEPYHLPFNPLALTFDKNPKPLLPLHTANCLKETIAKAFGLGIKQETILREAIMDAYELKGIVRNDPTTWNRSAPTLNDVYKIYTDREDLKEDSLYAAFTNLIDFEIFQPNSLETKGLFDIIQGVTVIDLSAFDPGIQNLVVAITLDLFYSQMQSFGHSKIEGDMRQLSKIILVDEADNFLSKNFASLKKILKEGREFGVGTILSTQLLSHFSTGDNDYANYILTWVIHSVADLGAKDIKYLFNTKGKQEEDVMYNQIKELKKHYSIVKMGDRKEPVYMKDRAFWELVKE